jgi:membrane protein
MPARLPLTIAIRRTLTAFRHHNASRFAAALAFYIVFSIAPALLITIAISAQIFGRPQSEREILGRLEGSFGSAPGAAIAAMIRDAGTPRTGWLATILGLMTLYFGLAGVYRQVNDALRTIWRDDGIAHARVLGGQLASILFVLAAIMVVLLSVVADAAIAATGRYAAARLVGGELLWHVSQIIVSTLVLTVLFGAVFRSLVRGRLTWRDVRVGAALTAILFVAGKLALGIYLGKAAVGSAFGAAGSIVVVLLWSYWSAQIFFFGLELTHVYAQESA